MHEKRSPLEGGRIGYVFIAVTNFSEMLSFYRDRLGLELAYLEPGSCAFFRLNSGPQIALLAGRKTQATQQSDFFLAVDVDDIRIASSRLIAAGVEMGEIHDVPFGRAAKFLDPEGNTIEIHQLGIGPSR